MWSMRTAKWFDSLLRSPRSTYAPSWWKMISIWALTWTSRASESTKHSMTWPMACREEQLAQQRATTTTSSIIWTWSWWNMHRPQEWSRPSSKTLIRWVNITSSLHPHLVETGRLSWTIGRTSALWCRAAHTSVRRILFKRSWAHTTKYRLRQCLFKARLSSRGMAQIRSVRVRLQLASSSSRRARRRSLNRNRRTQPATWHT